MLPVNQVKTKIMTAEDFYIDEIIPKSDKILSEEMATRVRWYGMNGGSKFHFTIYDLFEFAEVYAKALKENENNEPKQ